MKLKNGFLCVAVLLPALLSQAQLKHRTVVSFDKNWKFYYADTTDAKDEYKNSHFIDAGWRSLDLPHDWSVEGTFSEKNPASPEGGALPGGIGWYRKTFTVPVASKGKSVFIDFDGVYRYSEVWINDHYLGKRPNGYISFRYELTPWLKYGDQKNVISVKVDNTHQPNSRWYSGSGIYRHTWLVTTSPVAVAHWGTYITTPRVMPQLAAVVLKTSLIKGQAKNTTVTLRTVLTDTGDREISRTVSKPMVLKDSITEIAQNLSIERPALWSVDHPYLYKATVEVLRDGSVVDDYIFSFGVRSFEFDADRGFILNGHPVKILGVCDHHDLGCLGSAVNTRAIERQLEILKRMGCNAIRTSHNPPAPELLDLCDRMGFIVMDEAFDMWKRRKTKYDYSLNWDEWHRTDLEDQLRRDRNHPCIFMWSIGNEIPEQRDSINGPRIARELAAIVRSLDTTRPITEANDQPYPANNIIKSGAVDLIGFNYHQYLWKHFHDSFPGRTFIGTETTSALETRGEYNMPSDSIRRWPGRHMQNGVRVDNKMNDDYTVSAYDNVSAPWGSTHEESWKEIKKYPFLSGMFIWTGFDYLGEPTPYSWPARSSYFGIIDLAGFPKDVYYMYQGEWTSRPVLHLLPHWNWNAGDSIDVWAYYSNADEVELFLNGKSLGIKKKTGEDLHIQWRVPFEAGTLKAISRKNGQEVLTSTVSTAGAPAKIELAADRTTINADGSDLSFVTVRILDAAGNLVPRAGNLVQFKLNGEAFIAGVDNGNPTSHEPFKASYRKAFNGFALAVIQAKYKKGKATLTAEAEGLLPATVEIELK